MMGAKEALLSIKFELLLILSNVKNGDKEMGMNKIVKLIDNLDSAILGLEK